METKKLHDKKRALIIVCFLAAVFIFLLCWAVIQPLNASPDEEMRYQIVQYIVRHGTLPDGRDPEIMNEMWGISYAYYPILAYMIMAVPAKIVSLFTSSPMAMLIAARLVNVIFGTGMAYLTFRIGEMVFPGKAKWLFTCLVTFLPGLVFVHSYVNNDSMAVFSATWIVYVWVRSIKEGWSGKICVQLAAAISMCALSYYNAYGYILCSLLFFVFSILLCRTKDHNVRFLFSRGALIVFIVLVLAGWWFIRNAILYNGDFLGMNISNDYAEMYAAEAFKPSNKLSLQEQGMGLGEMFFYRPDSWTYNWIITVAISFIGSFGYMDIPMPLKVTELYCVIFAVGLVCCLFAVKKLFKLRMKRAEMAASENEFFILTPGTMYRDRSWNIMAVFHICMALAMVIPFILLVQYSYTSDLQAQGRYILSMVIPFMYFITCGYQTLLNKFVKNQKAKNVCYAVISLICVAGAVYTYVKTFLPHYI